MYLDKKFYQRLLLAILCFSYFQSHAQLGFSFDIKKPEQYEDRILGSEKSESKFFSRVQAETDRAFRRHEGVVIWWDRKSGQQTLFGDAEVLNQSFRPGSVFKIAVAEEAILRGLAPSYTCTGRARIAGRRLFCWNRKGHGTLDLAKALAISCNLFFANLGDSLGETAFASIVKRYAPLLDAWSATPATAGEMARFAIGDDFRYKLTPRQMAQFWEAFLTRWNLPEYAAMRQGLRRAVGEGTAARAGRQGIEFIGKTGTCDSETKLYKTDAWFVGAYPADEPRYGFVIFLKEAYGFREASGLAGKVVAAAKEWLP